VRHVSKPAAAAYATSFASTVKQHSSNTAVDVYDQGRYLGSDPDPRIRTYLIHDRRDDL
jgi:hypothetical protein